MPPSLTAPEIEQLSIAQRLDLIGMLWDSIPDSLDDLLIPDWHKEVLDQRLAEADAAPDAGIPWEQVRSELRSQP